jgi:cytochrome b561
VTGMAETHNIDMQMISESSSVNRGLLLSFILFEVYMLVTVAATTDLMLLVPSTVKLPLANIDIPLFGFYIIAPLFMIALHFNLLVHLQQHTAKVRTFLRQQIGSGRKHDVNLPPFLFNYLQQFQPGQLQYRLLFFVLYVMVVLFPAAVLLYAQFKFSKYHSWAMTGWHYGVLLAELYVIRLYWPRIVHQGEIEDEPETWQGLFEREKRALLRPLLQIIVAALILAGPLMLMHRFSPEWSGSWWRPSSMHAANYLKRGASGQKNPAVDGLAICRACFPFCWRWPRPYFFCSSWCCPLSATGAGRWKPQRTFLD